MTQSGPVLDNHPSFLRRVGLWAALVRALWLTLFLLNLLLFVLSVVQQLPTLLHPCTRPTCLLSPVQAETLHQMGISLSAFATYYSGTGALVVLAGAAIALLLFLRRSDDWFTLVVGLFLLYPVTSFAVGPATQISVMALLPVLVVGEIIYYAVFLLFPDGRFVPRWSWLLLVVWIVAHVAAFADASFGWHLPVWLDAYYPLLYLSALGIQIYRYNRTSTVRQRQQTKWVILGVAVALLTNILYWIVVPLAFLAFNQPDSLYTIAAYPVYEIAWLALPVCFAIAIQRHQLFDVDVLINRTLVYGTLTAIVATMYFGVVVGAQAVVGTVDRQASHSPVILVGSTLLIAALFTRLRRVIQSAIDRRFYRSKYDATHTLETFTANLQMNLDLAELRAHLVAVVQDTLEPESVFLLLFDPPGGRREIPNS